MPVSRQLVALDGAAHIERVRAAADGSSWGPEHVAQGWRCVLPGIGQVFWRNAREQIFVDPLTAFRLDAGEPYQLRHEAERDHLVLCSRTQRIASPGARAWLMRPRDQLGLRTALAQVRRGDLDLTAAVMVARRALGRAFPLQQDESAYILRARRCLASHLHERLRVEEVAEEARCSPFHLSRLFGQHLGVSVHRYQLHLRLAVATERLEDRSVRLADLAIDLGFSHQSHFGDVFHRTLGFTPAKARTALR